MASVLEELKSLASVDLFKTGRDSATFVGRPFACDYTTVKVLMNDKWKNNVVVYRRGPFFCAFTMASRTLRKQRCCALSSPHHSLLTPK